jgi:REP element-mobilizing transposase RayT
MTIAAVWSTCPTKRHRPHSNSLWERDFVYRPTRTHRRFDCLHAHLVFVTKYRHGEGRPLRQQYRTDVRKYLWGKHFWSPSYFAASCGGARLTAIKQDIEQQNRRN